MQPFRYRALWLLAALALIPAFSALAEEPAPPGFARVQRILKNRCVSCHNAKSKLGIDLRTHASIMRGGRRGKIVVPGNPGRSVLAHSIRAQHGRKPMPPGKRLPASEIQAIERWIKAGAKPK